MSFYEIVFGILQLVTVDRMMNNTFEYESSESSTYETYETTVLYVHTYVCNIFFRKTFVKPTFLITKSYYCV